MKAAMTLVEQFNKLKESKKIKKKDSPKGPVDLKVGREQVKQWNEKNRRP